MAMIKSALEIALERTKDLKADPAVIAAAEAKQEGKRLAGEYLADPTAVDLGKRLAALAKDRRAKAKEGAFEVLASRIQLPTSLPTDLAGELATIATGVKALDSALFGDKRIQGIFDQLGSVLGKYLEDAKRVEEAIRKQYAPRLKQKEQEMAARMGRAVRLDPMQDPEFAAFYKQNVGQMRDQYQAFLDKTKADLAALCGLRKDD